MRNKRLINYVKELFRNDVMGARVECGDLPKLVVEYLIARYFERWDAQLTPTRVMKLLAAALFINPPSTGGDIDIHELAYCFGYRIYKYPVYSQVVMESLNELRREGGRIATKSVLDIDVRVLIRKGGEELEGGVVRKSLRTCVGGGSTVSGRGGSLRGLMMWLRSTAPGAPGSLRNTYMMSLQ